MSNLFQDVNGTTPVTADGQPVGLVLDKSRSGVNLAPNGDFNTDSDWVLSGSWYIQDGKLFDPVAPSGLIESSIFSLTGGQEYEASIQSTGSGGNPTLVVKKGTSHVHTFTVGSNPSDGVYTSTFTAPSDGSDYYLEVSSSNYIGSFQFISVRQVNSVALGSELVTGNTKAVLSGWVDNQDGSFTAAGTNLYISMECQMVAGTVYQYSYTVDEYTSGQLRVGLDLAYSAYRIPSQGEVYVGYMVAGSPNADDYLVWGSNFTGTISNLSVKEVLGTHASQPVATQRPTYNANPDRLTLDLVDDGLLVNIPVGGWDGYMVVGTDQGTASYGVSLPAGDYELGGDYFFGNTINQVLFREGAVEPAHLKAIEYVFIGDGAKESYGDVIDFTNYWRDKNITEFPLVDTSSGTSFIYAWYSNSLTSFPLINTSSGTNFQGAWFNNNLTSFPLIDTSSGTNFQSAWQNNNLTSFPLIDTSVGANFLGAWYGNNLTSFPLIDTSSGTNFQSAWQNNNLTSFPLLDTSSGANFTFAWRNNNLTSFPLINTSSGTNFSNAWLDNNLTSFPLIDTSSGTTFNNTWRNNNLTSFPLIDTSNGTNFQSAWENNSTLADFPANMFDNCLCTNFTFAFVNTALTQASIDGILVSINSNGTSNGTFTQSGGSAPSATGQAAIDAMRSRGWTITVTGGY